MNTIDDSIIQKAALLVRDAEVFIITAGAGMGVDSGLPDFRGNKGFWKAYPEYSRFGTENRDKRIVVIEMGAGGSIPTIRRTSERIARNLKNASVIRINPRESAIQSPHLSIPLGALDGLLKIDAAL